MKLQQPWPDGYSINERSPYGWRKHPITGRRAFHHGVDVAGVFPVTAAGDGIVVHVSFSRAGGGHVVIIKHADDLFTVYYHGRDRTSLRKNQRVRAGDFVYMSGNTGASTGPHLHFETRYAQRWGATKDPQIFLTGSRPEQPTGDNPYKVSVAVNGRESRATWKAWQTGLKARWDYPGILDGRPGPLTWRAVQRFAGVTVNGVPGPETRRGVQTKLAELGLYDMRVDGAWGKGTWSAIQRGLNQGVL